MNDVFPQVRTTLLAEAAPGSILKIPRLDDLILALVTGQTIDNVKSVVMLDARFPNGPRVMFAQKWKLIEPCLCFGGKIRFELGVGADEIDDTGHNWWRTPGVIVSIEDALFLRAGAYELGPEALVNIRTGALFGGQKPNSLFTFGSWKLFLIDEVTKQRFELCKFIAPKPNSQ
jgi:hypothetical protein